MQAIVFDRPGPPEVLRLEERPDPKPGAGELLVRVRAAGVNRADLLQRLGRYPAPPGASDILGLEIAGEVVAAGAGCTRFALGARVMAVVAGGGYATLAVIPEAVALPVPENLAWTEAGAIPEAFLTAYLNLFDLGMLTSGETVLVHAGASGVGSAAIQLAREAGATALATVGSDAKLDFCRWLGAVHAFHRETQDFAREARAATGGEGVHLVVDFVGAPYWARNLEALRRGGRLVLVGFLGGSQGDLDLGPVMRKSLTVRGTTLRGMAPADKARLTQRAGAFLLPRLASSRLRPLVDRTYALADAAEAHRVMHDNRNLGKIVLEV